MSYPHRGAAGRLQVAEIDTAHFKGNFPESCELHGYLSAEREVPTGDSELWIPIMSRARLGPNRRHFFQLETNPEQVFTHVKVTIYPDGGIKRVRIVGTRGASQTAATVVSGEGLVDTEAVVAQSVEMIAQGVTRRKVVPVLPLTHEAFAPYGQVIQAYGDPAAAPRGTKITPANGGTASKFHKLALPRASYPDGAGATCGLSAYRCQPVAVENGRLRLGVVERHPYTNQAFVPMGGGGTEGDEAIRDPGKRYLVVVALNGEDDRPDLKTVRAFVASAGQGVMYNPGVWRKCLVCASMVRSWVFFPTDQPMTVLDKVNHVSLFVCMYSFRLAHGPDVCGDADWEWRQGGL